jgi:hypothetical protein
MIMASLEHKKDAILGYETTFAYTLAGAVFEKPKMNVWMILIPIIIVFHMYRHQRYVEGRRSFADNYLITRRRALDAAISSCRNNDKVNLAEFVNSAGIPEETKEEFRAWVELLIQHYQELVLSNGEDYEGLARASYKNKMNYLLFFNSLTKAEKNFSSALRPHINENIQVLDDTIKKIDHHTDILRRQAAERIFS